MTLLDKYLTPVAAKMQANKILTAISRGLMMTMPILIIGSLTTLLGNLQIDAYQELIANNGIKDILKVVEDFTTNSLALYSVFTIAFSYVTAQTDDNGISAGIISILSFLVVTPRLVMEETGAYVISMEWLGAKGLFGAMFVAIVVALIYRFFLEKKLVLKMPDSVPQFVSNSFSAIVPAVVIVFVFATVALLFKNTSYGSMHSLIYTLIQKPLSGLGTTLSAVVIIYILEGLVWFVGIHAIAVAVVVLPIWLGAGVENLAGASNIVTWGWVNTFAGVGGAGGTLGLVILFILRSKSEKNKSIGKLSFVPSLFNINEPVVFGVPIVLNPYLLIPFVFTPVISLSLAYGLTKIGILPVTSGLTVPAGTPLFVSGYLTAGWQGALYQVFLIPLGMLIYYPFFRVYDKVSAESE